MDTDFYRVKRLPPYVIAEVNAMRAAARASGRDIIDLGMGNPDLPPPQHVIDKLCEVAQKPDAHGYSQSKGIPGLRKAQANYYQRRWGVELDPESEVVVTLGSKEGLASLATAITAPGDTILAPNPSYPIHTFGFIIAGATIRSVPTTPDEHYWESLDRAMRFTAPRPTVLVVNYPSNPTAPIPSSTTTACRRPRSSRPRGRWTSRSSSPASPRLSRWPAGGSASRSAIRR